MIILITFATIMQDLIHYFLHFIFPFFIAYFCYRKEWKKTYIILLSTMFIDLDHLIASPVFDVDKCSINYHPLHTYYAALFYIVMLFLRSHLESLE